MRGGGVSIGPEDVLAGYAAAAAKLIPRYEALSTTEVLAPVADLLPLQPAHILDVGAGTGRDAAWLAERGHRILAVEPAAALREAGMALHPSPNVDWVDDRLPRLATVRSRGDCYDLILLIGVVHHLPPAGQAEAIPALASMLKPQGRLIASLRHGPGPARRPCFPVSPGRLVRTAGAAGLRLVLRRVSPSIQPGNLEAGVSWTWLCFER